MFALLNVFFFPRWSVLICSCFGCSPHTIHRAHVGESEKALREAFMEASSHAMSGKPSVIFIDEIDALCPHRTSRYVNHNNAF